MKKLLTVKDIEARLQRSRNTVYQLLRTGQLKSIKVNGDYRVRDEDLEQYLNRLMNDEK